MSHTATQTPVTSGPVPAPRVVGQRRVRTGHLGLAVALVAIGGLLAAFAFYAATRTGDFLAVARPVAAGATITEADLAVVQVNSAAGLTPLAASQRGSVVGKRAKVSLVPGTLLTADQLTDTELVGPGQQQVGVGLKPEQMPASQLRPGDKVRLVALAAPNSSSTEESSSPEVFTATVVGASPRRENQERTVVYVAVSESDAARVVELAGAERLGVVLTGTR
ncbi:SAF domain-containing protein [Cryptosporangium arvum]|uniref:Flagellar basal body P-ring biosynthesis protein n=1 Tax=Cryptosporangium arvum DSM 44712 TaxID=927661 RepID=A0A011AFB9_9ACTN|nr:SAF domain-containing protein [Cryptosporangium arvum]EXG80716.1 flagellar basal body P-ring biosynthesis protein [Cryptosporangium arvum DSM 44712]